MGWQKCFVVTAQFREREGTQCYVWVKQEINDLHKRENFFSMPSF